MSCIKIWVSCAILCTTVSLNAQRNESLAEVDGKLSQFTTRLGFGTLSYVNLEYENRLKPRLSFYSMIGFKHGLNAWSEGSYLCGWTGLQESRKKRGAIAGVGITVRPEESRISSKSTTIYTEYRYTIANEIIDDEGCYGGSSIVSLSIYDIRASELALIISFEGKEKKKGRRPFFSIGGGLAFIKRTFETEGTVEFPVPSTRIELTNFPVLRMDFGFRL